MGYLLPRCKACSVLLYPSPGPGQWHEEGTRSAQSATVESPGPPVQSGCGGLGNDQLEP